VIKAWIRLWLGVLFISLSPILAAAPSNLEIMIERLEARDPISVGVVIGIGAGLELGNQQLTASGQGKMFCPPATVPLNDENYRHILLSFWKRHKQVFLKDFGSYAAQGMAAILMLGLREAFPCAR
jgi:hypothetical protein